MENRKGNIIFISTLVICAIIGLVYYINISSPGFEKNSEDLSSAPRVISDIENTINLTLPSKTSYQVVPDENYLLKLENSTNAITLSKNDTTSFSNQDLFSLITLDKELYLENFENIKTKSEIRESTINNYKSYNYSFSYSENDIEYLVQIFWIKTDKNLYTLDLKLPYYLLEKESQEFVDILYSFNEI